MFNFLKNGPYYLIENINHKYLNIHEIFFFFFFLKPLKILGRESKLTYELDQLFQITMLVNLSIFLIQIRFYKCKKFFFI